MASPKLPILKIPRVAFELIHEKLNFSDIFHLSRCSKASKNWLRSFEAYQKDTYLRVTVAENVFRVVVENEKRGRFEVPDNQFINKETDIIFWVSYLKDLFQCPIGFANIKIDELNFEMLFVENEIFHQIEQEVEVEAVEFTDFQIKFLLDKLITKKLSIWGQIPINFSYHQSQFPESICIEKAHWVTVDNLFDMMKSCESVILARLRLSDKDWNKVIRSWLEGDNSKIKFLSIHLGMPGGLRDYDPAEIFEGMVVSPGAKKRSNASRYFKHHVQYDNGYDIKRPDGTMATMFIDCTARIELFIFTVWDVPDPNLE